MEKTINDMKKELSQEREKSKKFQDDLSAYTERESKMTQSMSSVIFFFITQMLKYHKCKRHNGKFYLV